MKLSQFRFKLPDDRLALDPPHKEFKNEDGTVEKGTGQTLIFTMQYASMDGTTLDTR